LKAQSQRKSWFLHEQKVPWDKLVVEATNLWSREAEACQRAKRAEKELAALHQETTEAA
jgi:hypothetical protein